MVPFDILRHFCNRVFKSAEKSTGDNFLYPLVLIKVISSLIPVCFNAESQQC